MLSLLVKYLPLFEGELFLFDNTSDNQGLSGFVISALVRTF